MQEFPTLVKKPYLDYYIGVDVSSDDFTFCIMSKYNGLQVGTVELVSSFKIRDNNDIKEQIERLSEFYNCTVLTEFTHLTIKKQLK